MEALDCMEFAISNNAVESLWIRIKGQANKGDVVEVVFYRPPSHDNGIDELLFKEQILLDQLPLYLWGTSTGQMSPRNITLMRQTSPGDS